MDIEKLASGLDEERRALISQLGNTDAAKALGQMFSQAELMRAVSGGDEAAMKDVLHRVLSTEEGKKLAQMLGNIVK